MYGKQMDDAIGQYFMSDCAACHWARSGVCVHLLIHMVVSVFHMENGACVRASLHVILGLKSQKCVCVCECVPTVRLIQSN